MTLSVYRVVQESLTDFLRRAGSLVDVSVVPGEKSIGVIVRDAGFGLAVSGVGRRRGLQAMGERVRACGATLTASAVVGGGCEVRAVFPVESS